MINYNRKRFRYGVFYMINHYETAKYNHTRHERVTRHPDDVEGTLTVDASQKYQRIVGFGGAFTEAAAFTLSKMSFDKRNDVLNAYFHKTEGLGYNLGRVAINSCDFSLENYSYVEDYDENLSTFSIERDKAHIIPMIKDAEKVRGDTIELLASPWSPPAWMKDNNDMNHGGKLLSKYRQVWADYMVKFVETYQAHDVSVFALSVQNEPAAKQVWDSCLYTGEEERDFVKYFLGPTIEKSKVPKTKIFIWDHNRDLIVKRAKAVLEDPVANAYTYGIAFHWYVSEAFENLHQVHKLFPDKALLFTEGTIEGGVSLHAFESGERYARNMIGDFSHYCTGYIDWNLTLDEHGGPNHVGNYCDAPIICDTEKNIIHKNYSYDAIGHFSKHIERGALRIGSSSNHDGIKHVAFENPNGKKVLVVQNETEEDCALQVSCEHTHHNILFCKRSISTITF